MNTLSDLRPSPIAGTWYSGSAEALAKQVDGYLARARLPVLSGQVVGLVAPHAGHRYSGHTAAHAFGAVASQSFDLVAVISPMHAYHPAALLTTAHRGYSTPLGPVWVDEQARTQLEDLLEGTGTPLRSIANDQEHSLEIELPFLQRALQGEFRLLPVMVRSMSEDLSQQLGSALAQVLRGRSALLVASTDLSHFYSQQTAEQLDGEMLRRIAGFAPEEVLAAERTGVAFACGAGAVAAVLWAARLLGADTVKILHHSTSADETDDRGSVVGYGAAAILKTT